MLKSYPRGLIHLKIAILGHSGSGKSTLAKQLAGIYKIPLLFLDTIQFESNWKEREFDESQKLVAAFMKQDSWVIDGNYTKFFQSERLLAADQIIYMDFPRRVCLYQVLKRYFKFKNQTRDSISNGCIEKIDFEFIWWILHEGRTKSRRSHYKQMIDDYKDKIIVLKNKKQVESFLFNGH